ADIVPPNETTLFGDSQRVADADITFASDTLTIVAGPPLAGGSGTDINGDGIVSPLDALLLINELSVRGGRQLDPFAAEARFDVNGDGYLSPLDPLLVINQLQREGDRPRAPRSSGATDSGDPSATGTGLDDGASHRGTGVAAGFSGNALLGSGSRVADSATTRQSRRLEFGVWVASGNNQEDDFLDDISADVANAWRS
ncbi:MAG TPA: dockerin type I domain-containing protein, partial [Pirellulaceae bacterium]